jgi:hypothetical protein
VVSAPAYRRFVPTCLPSPCVSSRHLPARRRVHPGSRDPIARRHSVKVGRCLPAGPSLLPGAGGSPPGRVFESRAWWSPPRQPGGPHCRPVLKSLGVDDARTMGLRLKQTNRLSRECAWRGVGSRRVRRNQIQHDTPDAQRRACAHSAPLLPSFPWPISISICLAALRVIPVPRGCSRHSRAGAQEDGG